VLHTSRHAPFPARLRTNSFPRLLHGSRLPVQAVKGRDGVDRHAGGSRSIKADIGEPFSSREFPSERQTRLGNVGQHFSPRPVPTWGGLAHVTWPALGMGWMRRSGTVVDRHLRKYYGSATTNPHLRWRVMPAYEAQGFRPSSEKPDT